MEIGELSKILKCLKDIFKSIKSKNVDALFIESVDIEDLSNVMIKPKDSIYLLDITVRGGSPNVKYSYFVYFDKKLYVMFIESKCTRHMFCTTGIKFSPDKEFFKACRNILSNVLNYCTCKDIYVDKFSVYKDDESKKGWVGLENIEKLSSVSCVEEHYTPVYSRAVLEWLIISVG